MSEKASVYKETYRNYLKQISMMDRSLPAKRLGIEVNEDTYVIPYFGKNHVVTDSAVKGPDSKTAAIDTCVILSRYLLNSPDVPDSPLKWCSFNDFKDAGPLRVYFSNEVTAAIARKFSGKTEELIASAKRIGGESLEIGSTYDVSIQFTALPKLPIGLLFNDKDDEFKASCTILFNHTADIYLDPECLAMPARNLYVELEKGCD